MTKLCYAVEVSYRCDLRITCPHHPSLLSCVLRSPLLDSPPPLDWIIFSVSWFGSDLGPERRRFNQRQRGIYLSVYLFIYHITSFKPFRQRIKGYASVPKITFWYHIHFFRLIRVRHMACKINYITMTNYKIMFNVIILFWNFFLWNRKIKKNLEKEITVYLFL